MSVGEYEFKREYLIKPGKEGNKIFFRKWNTFQPDI